MIDYQVLYDRRGIHNQVISDSRTLKVKDDKKGKARKAHKRVVDPAGIKWYVIVGSKTWNECYLEYEWNDHGFGKKRKQPLPEFMNTVEKRRQT